jgi:imidazolonepropionase-like amidohydrolase
MKNRIITSLLLLSLLLSLWTPSLGQQRLDDQSKILVLNNATVIDATGAPARHNMTVVIVGNRITAIGKTGKLVIPKGAQVLDATGKYLIPALWDMHAHALRRDRIETFLPLLVANGVTGIRDMGVSNVGDVQTALDQFEESKKVRKEIEARVGAIPRIVAAGVSVSGQRRVWPDRIEVRDQAAARQAVITLKAHGADFIKVYGFVPRDAYLALAEEAKRQKLPFVGHAPDFLSLAEASDAGQKSIEHLSDILLACSTDEETLRSQTRALIDGPEDPRPPITRLRIKTTPQLLSTFSEQKAEALFSRFKRNMTWQVPTLVIIQFFAYSSDPEFTSSQQERLKYITSDLKERLSPRNDYRQRIRTETPEIIASNRKQFEKNVELVGRMNRAGVPILAGTDAVGAIVPGFSLHDELALLVRAGLTPMEALQSATLNPAKFLGLSDSLGTIEKGKIADLVLLEANPLEDIRNTRRIDAVVVNGRYLPKEALQRMLDDVEAAARK